MCCIEKISKLMSETILSILIFTHNHGQFIERCISSVLNQKCTYNYCVHVFDDASCDNTVEIVEKFCQEYPEKVSLVTSKENLGVLHSAKMALSIGRTKYIAFLDGDDYWCYEGKLQAQLDFLEGNEDYSGCFHDAEIRHLAQNGDEEFQKKTKSNWKTYSQINKYYADVEPHMIVCRTIIPTSSLISRWRNIDTFVHKYNLGELSFSWAIDLEQIRNSKFKYFNECWSVYNDHPAGASKKYGVFDFKRNNIKILESLIDDDFYRFYAPEIYQTICSEFRMMIKSDEALRMSKREYRRLLSEYKSYQKKEIKVERRQYLHDYDYLNGKL